MNQLPQELVDRIFDYLSDDAPTLAKCALVNRDLWGSACRILYRKISYNKYRYFFDYENKFEHRGNRTPTRENDLKLMKTIGENKTIAEFVKVFENVLYKDGPRKKFDHREDTLLPDDIVKAAGKNLCNLEVATFYSSHLSAPIFRNFSKHGKLKELHVQCDNPQNFMWRPNITTNLTKVEWMINPARGDVVQKCWTVVAAMEFTCPKLVSLTLSLPREWDSKDWYEVPVKQDLKGFNQWIVESNKPKTKLQLKEFHMEHSTPTSTYNHIDVKYPWDEMRQKFIDPVVRRFSNTLTSFSIGIGEDHQSQNLQIECLRKLLPCLTKLDSLKMKGAVYIWVRGPQLPSPVLELIKEFSIPQSKLYHLGQRLKYLEIDTIGVALSPKLGTVFTGLQNLRTLHVATDEQSEEGWFHNDFQVKYDDYIQFVRALPPNIEELRIDIHTHVEDDLFRNKFEQIYYQFGKEVFSHLHNLRQCNILVFAHNELRMEDLDFTLYFRRLQHPSNDSSKRIVQTTCIHDNFYRNSWSRLQAQRFDELIGVAVDGSECCFVGKDAEPYWDETFERLERSGNREGLRDDEEFTPYGFQAREWIPETWNTGSGHTDEQRVEDARVAWAENPVSWSPTTNV